MSYLQAIRLFSRNTRLYLFSSALVGFCFYGIYTVLFNLYLLRLGYGPEFIGLANAMVSLPIVLSALPAGMLGRRWGVRTTLIVGAAIIAAGLGLTPFADLLPVSLRSGWVLSTYSLLGLGAALYMVNGDPFLMGSTGPQDRDQAFSTMLAMGPIAGFIGSIVAGLLPGVFTSVLGVSLDHPAPYRYPLWIAAALFATTVLAFLASDEVSIPGAGSASPELSASSAQQERERAAYVVIALLGLVGLLRMTGENATLTFLNLYMDADLGASTVQIGILSAVGQLVGGPVSLAMPPLARRWGKGPIITLGILGIALSVMVLALIPHWAATAFGFIGVIALAGVTRAAAMVYSPEIVVPHWRPLMSGATNLMAGVSGIAVSLGGGYAIAALGYRPFFLIGACTTAAGSLLFWVYFCVLRRDISADSPIG